MTYMKRNVNLLLMVLLLTVLMSIVLLTAFYQKNYRNITENYEETAEALQLVSQNFSSKLQELNRTTSELQIKSTDKSKLDTLYGDLTDEKDRLEAELKETSDNLKEAMSVLQDTESKLSDAQYTLLKQDEEITMLDNSVTNQKSKINKLKAENCDLNRQIDPAYAC